MITQYIFSFIIAVFSVIFGWLPEVTTLPLGIDSALVTLFGWLRSLVENVWPIQIILTCLLWYLSFRIGLMVLKFFIGHRAPKHD